MRKGHGFPSDWWALGCVVYEMLTGSPPFYHENVNVIYERIKAARLEFPAEISVVAQDFIKNLLEKDARLRLGSKGAQDVKSHPFFQDMDWEKLWEGEIEVPFKPSVESISDTTYIDEEFKSEAPKFTPELQLKPLKDKFEGFSFTGTESLRPSTEMLI